MQKILIDIIRYFILSALIYGVLILIGFLDTNDLKVYVISIFLSYLIIRTGQITKVLKNK